MRGRRTLPWYAFLLHVGIIVRFWTMLAMTPNAALVMFVVIVWSSLWLTVKISHIYHGRPWTDGPSFVPVIPVFPALAVLVGAWLNKWLPPYGTIGIVVLHVAFVGLPLIHIWTTDRDNAGDSPNEAQDGG